MRVPTLDRNHVSNLVHSQKRELEEAAKQVRLKAAAEKKARREAELERQRAVRREAAARRREAREAAAFPQPTKAEKRRAATTPVKCSVCGKVIFRRKKDAESRTAFFCSPAHQASWNQKQRQAC